jgi:hypothetical protein
MDLPAGLRPTTRALSVLAILQRVQGIGFFIRDIGF